MRIGLDIDGVLANFYKAYEDLTIEVSGRDLFGPNRYPAALPPVWNWPEHYGYMPGEMKRVWEEIKKSDTFWLNLDPLENGMDIARELSENPDNDLYFITARPGKHAKRQTEWWLIEQGIQLPTVLLSEQKGHSAAALELDIYVDDKLENVLDVWDKWDTCYLLDRPYNRHTDRMKFIRVTNLAQVFHSGHVRVEGC